MFILPLYCTVPVLVVKELPDPAERDRALQPGEGDPAESGGGGGGECEAVLGAGDHPAGAGSVPVHSHL